jgi:hypothetical protein
MMSAAVARSVMGRIVPIAVFFVGLFAMEWYLFFRNPGHFFQADTVFHLYHRPATFIDFLRMFVTLDRSGWYRPLSQQLPFFILFPFFGLNPVGYRICIYVFFAAMTIGVYHLSRMLMQRGIAAGIATIYFASHTTNAFTTYDLSFAPELCYAAFYLLAVLTFYKFCRVDNRGAYNASIVFLIGALLSKEAAVTLPMILFLLYVVFDSRAGTVRLRIFRAVRAIRSHAFVVLLYFAFVVGYLHVQGIDLRQLFNRPKVLQQGGYYFVVDKGALENIDLALTWAFNIPRGWHGDFRHVPNVWVSFLKGFRIVIVLSAMLTLFTNRRRIVFFGVGWFLISIIPTLPLANHFMPYYLFLPMIGVSLVVGTSLSWLADCLRQAHEDLPGGVIALTLAGVVWVCSISVEADTRSHRLLGGSARLAYESLVSIRRLYPAVSRNAILYIDDVEEPLAWDHAWGGLIQMAYDRWDVDIRYGSSGGIPDVTGPRIDNTLVMRYHEGRLIDETAAFRKNPSAYVPYVESKDYRLTVLPAGVSAGDTYTIALSGLNNHVVKIAYRLNGGSIETFAAFVDKTGNSHFTISSETRKGTYQFVGFNIDGQQQWIRSDAAIMVR